MCDVGRYVSSMYYIFSNATSRKVTEYRQYKGERNLERNFMKETTNCFCKEVSRKFFKFNENIVNIFFACVCDITMHS